VNDLSYDRFTLIIMGSRIGRGSILAATGAAICALLLGCGGSGGSGLSKAEFTKQADAICKQAQQEASEEALKGSIKGVAVVVATLLNKEADEIAALDGPSEDAEQIEAIVGSARKTAEALEAKGEYPEAKASLVEAEKLAAAYGLDECLAS
jgi:hypothetical protein